MRERARRAWCWLQRVEQGPAAAPVLVALSPLVYGLVALAFPLAAGRDLGTYLRASFELRHAEVVLPQALLGRVPVTGLFAEGVLSIGPVFAEVAMALLYTLSIVCWWRVARRCGPVVAVAVPLLLLAYPGYAMLFHRLSSDALFAAGFAVAALLTARLVELPTWGRAAALGLGVALLVFTRPVAQLLVLMAPLVLLLPGPWRMRAGRLAALGAAAVVPLGAWAAHNAVRADDFTVVRGGGQAVPLYRAFVVEGIVRPENRDATRELARAVVAPWRSLPGGRRRVGAADAAEVAVLAGPDRAAAEDEDVGQEGEPRPAPDADPGPGGQAGRRHEGLDQAGHQQRRGQAEGKRARGRPSSRQGLGAGAPPGVDPGPAEPQPGAGRRRRRRSARAGRAAGSARRTGRAGRWRPSARRRRRR